MNRSTRAVSGHTRSGCGEFADSREVFRGRVDTSHVGMSSSLSETAKCRADVEAAVSFDLTIDTDNCQTTRRDVDFSRSTLILLVKRRSETLAIRRLRLVTGKRNPATPGGTKPCDESSSDDDTAVQQLAPVTRSARRTVPQRDQLPSLDDTTRHVMSPSDAARQGEVSKHVRRKAKTNRTSGRRRETASTPVRPLLPDIARKRNQRKQYETKGARQMNAYRLQPMHRRPCGTTFAPRGTTTVTPDIQTTSRSARSLFALPEHVPPTPHVTLAVVPCRNIVIDESWDRGDYRKTCRGALRMGLC